MAAASSPTSPFPSSAPIQPHSGIASPASASPLRSYPLAHSRNRNTSLKASAAIRTYALQQQQQQQQHSPSEQPQDVLSPSELSSSPTSAMHWTKIYLKGSSVPPPLRAHTATVIGSRIYVFAGCDANMCYSDLHVLDTETLWWSKPKTFGTPPLPCRAHSASLIQNRYLIVFGGGDGPNYFNTLHLLDTATLTWYKPPTAGAAPSPRRAHAAFVYSSDLYIYAGGDGVRALSDLYVLNTSVITSQNPTPTLSWTQLATTGPAPQNRGYHTANLIRNTPHLVLFGGSDGHECFSSIHLLNLTNLTWSTPQLTNSPPRLSHTATQIGSYLFVLGGHDGAKYSNAILLLNLVTMNWETRKICAKEIPEGRGYHTAVLCDSRLWVFGGYDGEKVFGDCWALELGASAYLPQITSFEVGGSAGTIGGEEG